MKSEVAILAGGLGSRLASENNKLPKALIPVVSKPILQHQIELCKKHGLTKIALLVCHKYKLIQNYFGDGKKFDVEIQYFIEKKPRGTAGALKDALDHLCKEFLVLYADTFMQLDLTKFIQYHIDKKSPGTLVVHPNNHPYDSDVVEVDSNDNITAIHGYPHTSGVYYQNLVNAAVFYLKSSTLVNIIPNEGKYDIAKDIIPKLLKSNIKLKSYNTVEYIKDMGTPLRLKKVEKDISNALPNLLSNRKRRTAVFIDRDGTINCEVGHLNNKRKLKLLTGASKAIRTLNESGILTICITNQPVIARGELEFGELDKIHAKLDYILGLNHAFLDRKYICPHHPDKGFDGEIAALKIDCNCRKPKPGLINNAIKDLNISRKNSWLIGDTTSDILAGHRAGLRTVLVETGFAGLDSKYSINPNFIARNLLYAVNWIMYGHKSMVLQLKLYIDHIKKHRLVLIGGLRKSGKTTVSNVICELLVNTNRKIHKIRLNKENDTDLMPRKDQLSIVINDNYITILKRLKILNEAKKSCESIKSVNIFQEMSYTKTSNLSKIEPEDIIIIEYENILCDSVPKILENTFNIFVDVSENHLINRKKEQLHSTSKKYGAKKIYSTNNDINIKNILEQSKKNSNCIIKGNTNDNYKSTAKN